MCLRFTLLVVKASVLYYKLFIVFALTKAGELERVEMETILSLKGFGLSLVNNYIKQEVAYMGITR